MDLEDLRSAAAALPAPDPDQVAEELSLASILTLPAAYLAGRNAGLAELEPLLAGAIEDALGRACSGDVLPFGWLSLRSLPATPGLVVLVLYEQKNPAQPPEWSDAPPAVRFGIDLAQVRRGPDGALGVDCYGFLEGDGCEAIAFQPCPGLEAVAWLDRRHDQAGHIEALLAGLEAVPQRDNESSG